MQVRAQQGDTIDQLCWRHLRRTDIVVAALEINPRLADLGPVIPVGTVVTLPAASATPAIAERIKLWD